MCCFCESKVPFLSTFLYKSLIIFKKDLLKAVSSVSFFIGLFISEPWYFDFLFCSVLMNLQQAKYFTQLADSVLKTKQNKTEQKSKPLWAEPLLASLFFYKEIQKVIYSKATEIWGPIAMAFILSPWLQSLLPFPWCMPLMTSVIHGQFSGFCLL